MSIAIPAPTNCWTSAEQAFAMSLANTPAFQAFVEVSDVGSALKHVFGESLDRPAFTDHYTLAELDQLQQRFAMVYSANDGPFTLQRLDSDLFEPSGVMSLSFERRLSGPSRHDYDELPSASWREWKNTCGDIAYGLLAWIDQNGGPRVDGLEVTEYGANSQDRWESEGQYQGCRIELAWGFTQ